MLPQRGHGSARKRPSARPLPPLSASAICLIGVPMSPDPVGFASTNRSQAVEIALRFCPESVPNECRSTLVDGHSEHSMSNEITTVPPTDATVRAEADADARLI